MSKTDQNGTTLREHLKQVERQTGKTPSDLIGPDFPTELSYLWSLFVNLSNSRSAGMGGPNPLSYLEIESWSRLTGTPLRTWEVETIKRLDNTYLKVMAKGS